MANKLDMKSMDIKEENIKPLVQNLSANIILPKEFTI